MIKQASLEIRVMNITARTITQTSTNLIHNSLSEAVGKMKVFGCRA